MSFFHTSRRNQLRSDTTTAMTAINMHFTQKSPVRKAKPVGDIEAISKRRRICSESRSWQMQRQWLRKQHTTLRRMHVTPEQLLAWSCAALRR